MSRYQHIMDILAAAGDILHEAVEEGLPPGVVEAIFAATSEIGYAEGRLGAHDFDEPPRRARERGRLESLSRGHGHPSRGESSRRACASYRQCARLLASLQDDFAARAHYESWRGKK